MRRAGILLTVSLALVSVGVASARTPHAGIVGHVDATPTCHVERVPPEPGCAPRPLAARIRISRIGKHHLVRVVRSGANGRFKVQLPAALYLVTALPFKLSLPRPPAPFRVRVRAGQFTHTTITYDTGLR
jgi:hypothetical protein